METFATPLRPLAAPKRGPLGRDHLAVLGIFRNEAHILAEWCQHYINQGATRLILLNHLSTDHYRAVLCPFVGAGFVELIHVHGERPQIRAYNSLRWRLRRSCRWLLVCDLDEFVYGRRGHTIGSYLQTLPWSVSELLIPWKNFASSHHEAHPPGLVVRNFLHRWSYDHPQALDQGAPASENWCKYIVRTSRLRFLAVHNASVWFGHRLDANAQPLPQPFEGHLPLNETLLAQANLHLNHYAIQSREYFMNVKMQRPDVNLPPEQNPKSLAYFSSYDRNEIHDPELSRLASADTPAR
jgi:hypothetical protein